MKFMNIHCKYGSIVVDDVFRPMLKNQVSLFAYSHLSNAVPQPVIAFHLHVFLHK